MMGMRNRASRSRSFISPFTSATSCALGRAVSVKIVSTRSANDSAPGGKVLRSVRSLPCVGPRALISGVMSCCIVSCTVSSMAPYAANTLKQSVNRPIQCEEKSCLLVQKLWNLRRQREE